VLVLQSLGFASATGERPSPDDQVCDPVADYYLGMEDYPEAIQRHREVIDSNPNNALAHYHLGFAYGLMGQHQRELAEYEKAVSLGLDDWQLFLNLGLLYLENGQVQDATEVMLLSLQIDPTQVEAHNTLGAIYAEEGKYLRAHDEWAELVAGNPDYAPARANLNILQRVERTGLEGLSGQSGFAREP
jgi:tetratricopeptide (TPR) repeat protein